MNDLLETGGWNFFNEDGAIKLPSSGIRLLAKLPDIEKEISRIIATAREAKRSNSTPLLRPKSYLHRLIYILGSHVAGRADLEDTLREYLTNQIILSGGRVHDNKHHTGSNDIFHLCYRGITIEELPIRGGELTRSARGLRYAYNSGVPVEYLIGYLYQTAGGRPAPKTRNKIIEEDKEWDIDHPWAGFDKDGTDICNDPETPDGKEFEDDGWE